MGFYQDQIVPLLINLAMRRRDLADYNICRWAVLSSCIRVRWGQPELPSENRAYTVSRRGV